MTTQEIDTALADVIKERRKLIRGNARCVGCGATLTACMAQRGKDPDAPPWFGCCARGVDMRPCSHLTDQGRLTALLDEIAAGKVRTAAEVLAEEEQRHAQRTADMGKPRTWAAMVDQSEWWRTKDGTWVRIADMAESHRHNTARFILRRAARIEFQISLSDLAFADATHFGVNARDALENMHSDRASDPARWLRGTVLYRALAVGMEDDR